MTFKIGDRVRFKPEYAASETEVGTVTGCEAGGVRVQFEGEALECDFWAWALELVPQPIAPRGPRPLPIRQRVTLTAGKTLRQPSRAVWTQVHPLHSPRTSDGVRPWFV